MKKILLVLWVAVVGLTGGCVSYSDEQIRYTDSEHRSGQIKEWYKPDGITVPLN